MMRAVCAGRRLTRPEPDFYADRVGICTVPCQNVQCHIGMNDLCFSNFQIRLFIAVQDALFVA
ncbi:MAG: hypothetical protein JWQ23_3818 [Herminiimonas sp.]|nr:hypothetical protein [Herminiimonas sp.]